MSSDNWDIRSALRGQFETTTGLPAAAQRAWENQVFTPTLGTAWVREKFMPSSGRLTGTGTRTIMGTVQWSAFWPTGKSVKDADTLADAIVAAFNPPLSLAGLVHVYRSERLAALDEPNWYHIPVLVYWRVHRVTA